MELKGSHEYPVPVDAVIAMLEDASATVEKYESMGHREVEIVELVAGDGTLRIVSSRVVDVDLPGFAKKALKPTNTMTQTDEWQRQDDGSWSGTFDGGGEGRAGSDLRHDAAFAGCHGNAPRRDDRATGEGSDRRRQDRRLHGQAGIATDTRRRVRVQ